MQRLPGFEGYEAWRAGLQNPATAEICRRYALSFNKLDATWFLPLLVPHVTYESQSVFDVLEGAGAVSNYFRGKILALRGSRDGNVCAELAVPTHSEMVLDAHELAAMAQLSWFDALIAGAALRNGCSTLYSEDFNHGQQLVDTLLIQNPFKTK